MKIKGTVWFTTARAECIGIVYGENEVGERKAYVGVGRGYDEKLDTQLISELGAKIYPSTLKEVINWLEGE